MDSERELRNLRKKIEELSETLNNTLSRSSVRLADFDINATGYKDRDMLRRIQDYGIDLNDLDSLVDMYERLKSTLFDLKEDRADLIRNYESNNMTGIRHYSRSIRYHLGHLDSAIDISEEERNDRVESYHRSIDESNRERNPIHMVRNITRQIKELQFDKAAAEAMLTIMRNPGLRDDYIDLLEMENRLAEEEHYRDDQRKLTDKYNELCKAYMLLEKIERGMENPNLTPQHQLVMERDRENAIQKIEDAMQDPSDETRRKDILGDRERRGSRC